MGLKECLRSGGREEVLLLSLLPRKQQNRLEINKDVKLKKRIPLTFPKAEHQS